MLIASPNNVASYKKLAQFNAIVLEKNNESCMEYSYGKMIDELRYIEWSKNQGGGNHIINKHVSEIAYHFNWIAT